MQLILGSQSRGRRMVLDRAGYEYTSRPADIDEKAVRSDDYFELPLMVARAKMAALAATAGPGEVIITADSIALWHGQLREKPESETQAREWLRSYSEDGVVNVTGVVIRNTTTGRQIEGTETATAYFKTIPDEVIEALIEDGLVLHCAGAYAIEHPLLAPYVDRIEGEVSCVTGLPLTLLRQLLDAAGWTENEKTPATRGHGGSLKDPGAS